MKGVPRKLELDFAGPSVRFRWAGRVLIALAAVVCADVALSYQSLRGTLAALEAKAAASAPVRVAARKVSPEELALVADTVNRLATPWDELFAALESAATDEVALLGVEPDLKRGTVLISGDGKSYLAALGYVLNLSNQQVLSGVQLVRHEAKSNDPQGAVSFVVSAAWRK